MLMFFKLFSVTGVSLLLFYMVGAAVTRLFRFTYRERFFALFLSLIIGVSIVVSLYALICTRGNTIQIAVLIVLIIGWTIRSQSDDVHKLDLAPVVVSHTGASALPVLAVFSILVFCLQYFLLYDFSEYLKTPFQDYVYYSRLSMPLNHLGIETNSLEAIYREFLVQQPYHYFEIWLNALLVRVTGLPSAWVFFISSSAILLAMVCVGFAAIFAHFKFRILWIIIFSLIFLSVTGVKWPFLQNSFVSNGALLSNTLLCLHPKFAPIYIFVLLASLFLLNYYYLSCATLAILPLVFISTTPVAGIAVVALASYLLAMRQLSWPKALAMVAPIMSSVSYIILFYTFNTKSYQFPNAGQTSTLYSIIPQWSEGKVIFNIMVGVFINYAIYFIAYGGLTLLLLLLQYRLKALCKVSSTIWIWFITSLIIAAFMRAFGTHYLDSFQFFSNSMIPISSVMIALILSSILQRASSGLFVLTALILVFFIAVNFSGNGTGATRYSSKFMQKISQIAPRLGSRGAYILANSDYENAYMLSSDSYTAGNYMSSFKNDYAFVSLSELDIAHLDTDTRFKRDSVQAEQIIRKSSFYRFAKFQSLKQQRLSLDSLKYKFVFENGIGFICASKRAELPRILEPLVKTMYSDSLSGERLYVLHTKKDLKYFDAYQ